MQGLLPAGTRAAAQVTCAHTACRAAPASPKKKSNVLLDITEQGCLHPLCRGGKSSPGPAQGAAPRALSCMGLQAGATRQPPVSLEMLPD